MRQIATLVILGFLFSCAGAVVAGEPAGKDYHDKGLSGKDFSKAKLDGANFSDATLKGVNFVGAGLKKAIFKGATIEGGNFCDADLTGTDMRDTVGAICSMRTNFAGANFEGTTFGPSMWSKCPGANFKKAIIGGIFDIVDFSNANFCGASLRSMSAGKKVIFKGAIYDDDTSFPDAFDPEDAGMVREKAAAAGAVVAGVPKDRDYHDQDLKGKTFAYGTLNGADFSDATLKGVSFLSASLKKATFKGANIDGVNFFDADLTGADMRGTTGTPGYGSPDMTSATRTNLTGANFEGATFSPGWLGCKCRGANFKKSIISGIVGGELDFSKANFSGANLRGMKIGAGNVVFKGAIYDADTSFPEGFDPPKAGMVMAKADEAEKK